jgi:signal transduction histidine kinase
METRNLQNNRHNHLNLDRRFSPPLEVMTSTSTINSESKLHDLPLHDFQIDLHSTGQVLAGWFQDFPNVPGVILIDLSYLEPRLAGMISRSRFLEVLLNPASRDLFLAQPLNILQSHLRSPVLKLSGSTPILVAAQQALRRSPETVNDPILIDLGSQEYRLLDFHTLNIAYWQIRGIETQIWYERTQVQMIRNDKMASLGRLVDGVAHEILDPVSFIWGNLSHLMRYEQDVMDLLDRYEAECPEPSPDLRAFREEIEIEYLREDIPKTLDSIKSGADRLTKLATGLQNFCHMDEVYPKSTDIHDCLDGVLLLLKSRLKSDILVHKRYGHLPAVPCFVGKITQVFLNLLSALMEHLLIQAVTDRVIQDLPLPTHELDHSPHMPCITLTTETCSLDGSGSRWISIRIGRNGDPLAIDQQKQILDSFLQDSLLAQETSLVTTYRIVTLRHKGFLKLRTAANPADHLEPGMSTEFEILIPLA